MSERFDVLLLLALPASGKSEVRKFLRTFPPELCLSEFHIGPTVQLDDFPYVHFMRRIDEELMKMGHETLFFLGPERPFRDPWDWGTLIELLNEDFENLSRFAKTATENAAAFTFERFDRAALKACAKVKLSSLPQDARRALEKRLEEEAREQILQREKEYPQSLTDKTIVVEFARGGPEGALMPLPPPLGYAHSLRLLSPEILRRASLLYVWVTPEESRRRNRERADPSDPGSILHHCVPEEVMLKDYGCDDIEFLLQQSDRPGTVRVEAHGEVFYIPTVRFDNRLDKTSFVRKPQSEWADDEVSSLRVALRSALGELWTVKSGLARP